MAFFKVWVDLLGVLRDMFGQNDTLPLLLNRFVTSTDEQQRVAQALLTIDRDDLKEQNEACFEGLAVALANIKFRKMCKAMRKSENLDVWARVGLAHAHAGKYLSAALEQKLAGMPTSSPERSLLLLGFNRQFREWIKRLTKNFAQSSALTSFAIRLGSLQDYDTTIADSLLREIETEEQLDMLKRRDPALLGMLKDTFPDINLEYLYGELQPLEQDEFWETLSRLYDLVIVKNPIQDVLPRMEEATKNSMTEALRNNKDPTNHRQMSAHVLSEMMKDPSSANFVTELSKSILQENKIGDMKKFLKLHGLGHIDLDNPEALHEQVSVEQARQVFDQINGLDPSARSFLDCVVKEAQAQATSQ
jgi:hypothetical protein